MLLACGVAPRGGTFRNGVAISASRVECTNVSFGHVEFKHSHVYFLLFVQAKTGEALLLPRKVQTGLEVYAAYQSVDTGSRTAGALS